MACISFRRLVRIPPVEPSTASFFSRLEICIVSVVHQWDVASWWLTWELHPPISQGLPPNSCPLTNHLWLPESQSPTPWGLPSAPPNQFIMSPNCFQAHLRCLKWTSTCAPSFFAFALPSFTPFPFLLCWNKEPSRYLIVSGVSGCGKLIVKRGLGCENEQCIRTYCE